MLLLFFSILSGVSIGLIALMPTIPQSAIGKGFFRFNVFLSLVLIVPFAFFNPYKHFNVPFKAAQFYDTAPGFLQLVVWAFTLFEVFAVALLFLLYAKPTNPHAVRFSPYVYGGAVITGLAALFADSLLYLPHNGGIWWEAILIPLNLASSALLVSGALFAMLLGHWYLVQFDLDKRLLRRMALLYCIGVGVRTLIVGAGLYLYWKTHVLEPNDFRSLISLSGHGIFFWMRVLIGLGLPAVLCYMIYETARMGANQSCTGLLFIATIFVLMGEMVARYVFFLKGIPL